MRMKVKKGRCAVAVAVDALYHFCLSRSEGKWKNKMKRETREKTKRMNCETK